jgi:hypothetical protein
MYKSIKETRTPRKVGYKVQVAIYIDPAIHAAIEAKRGNRSTSAFIERILDRKLIAE